MAVAVALVCFASTAWAALGEPESSTQADQIRLGAVRHEAHVTANAAGSGVRIVTLAFADGSTVREYIAPSGRVFAVGWSTHFKPRLDRLLGARFAAYVDASRRTQHVRSGVRHAASARDGDLVVDSTSHVGSYVGRAYLKSLVPAGANADGLR